MVGQPRLRFDGQPAGVDGVAGGEVLCTAQDSGYRGTVPSSRRCRTSWARSDGAGTDRWAVRVCDAAGDAAQRNRVGGRRRRPRPARRRSGAGRQRPCAARRSPAARPGAPARPAPQPRSAPVADRSPSTPSIPAPPRCAHFRRIAPAGGNAAASTGRRAGSGP